MPSGQPYQWPETKSLVGICVSMDGGDRTLGFRNEHLRLAGIVVVALAEELAEPSCSHWDPCFVGAGSAGDGRGANLHCG